MCFPNSIFEYPILEKRFGVGSSRCKYTLGYVIISEGINQMVRNVLRLVNTTSVENDQAEDAQNTLLGLDILSRLGYWTLNEQLVIFNNSTSVTCCTLSFIIRKNAIIGFVERQRKQQKEQLCLHN